ncbi:MAG: PilT/PilU family type 4a pilus ATPase [Actinobacteria bacterium]|nr:PilT/PilU family type 4a pilus ATPase [Actinomycetota bacterium]
MAQVQKQLSDVLLEQGLVTAEQLDLATQEEAKTGKSSWKILLERGAVTERDLVRARAEQIGMQFVDVATVEPGADVIALVPAELAKRQMVLPVASEDNILVLAMADPRNHLAVDEVKRSSGKQVAPVAAYRQDLAPAIERVYGGRPAPVAPVAPAAAVAPVAPAVDASTESPPPAPDVGSFSGDDIPMVEAAPPLAPEIEVGEESKEPSLADFLMAVIESDGSDLHLTTGLPPMIRTYGDLRPLEGYRKLLPKDLQEIVYSILTQKQRERFEEDLELDISYSLPGRARFRVNIFQQRDALGAVMRLIPFEIKALDDLGIPSAVKEFARLKRGMVLVTGITGSGKSTTLAGLVDIVNSERRDHIMTVEDPIEFLHRHKTSIVNQREVGTDTHSFAGALKHVLRQDPDVILVGELRDLETIATALTAAETGHLVFATLHTQDAPQSVDRIIDVFPPHQQEQIRIMLAGSLAGVVSQQLVPRADGKGRAVAVELMITTPAIKNLIREGKTHQIYTSLQAGGQYGMQVMDQHLAELMKKGVITYEAALERCHRPEEFNRLAGKG